MNEREIVCEVCGRSGWVKPNKPALCPGHAALKRIAERDAAVAALREVVVAPFERYVVWLDRQLRRWAWLYRRLGGEPKP